MCLQTSHLALLREDCNSRKEGKPFRMVGKSVWSVRKRKRSPSPPRAAAPAENVIADGFPLYSELDLLPDLIFVSTCHFPPFIFYSPASFSSSLSSINLCFPTSLPCQLHFNPKIHLHFPNPTKITREPPSPSSSPKCLGYFFKILFLLSISATFNC